MMGRSRADVARKRLGHLVNIGLMSAARYADFWLILVTRWPEIQGFAPTEPQRCPEKTPTTTPTPRKKKSKSDGADAPGDKSPTQDPLLNLLSKEPGTPEEKAAWLARERPLLEEYAAGEPNPATRRRELRTRVIRHWRQFLRTGGSKTQETATQRQGRIKQEQTDEWLAEQREIRAKVEAERAGR
jgi:hypothetical protein